MTKPRLLGFGTAIVDLLAHVDDGFVATLPVQKGGTTRINSQQQRTFTEQLSTPPAIVPGGAVTNMLVGFAKLGGDCDFMALAGDDEAGRAYTNFLREQHVGVQSLRVVQGFPTGTCMSFITPDAERTMCTNLGANAQVSCDYFSLQDFLSFTHFFIEGYTFYYPEFTEYLLNLAHDAHLVTAMDLNSPLIADSARTYLQRLLPTRVDIIIANELEATTYVETNDIQQALEVLSNACPLAILKLGVNGVLIKERNKPAQHYPAYPVKAVDTTGAGDSWAAGFFSAYLHGRSLAEAAELGARVSAEVVKVTGAHLPEDVWQQLRRRITW